MILGLLRFLFRMLFNVCFRVEVRGLENYRAAGKRVLIIANHVSFLDGILLAVYLPRTPLFVINTYMAQNWWVKPFLWPINFVTIDPTNPLYVKSLIRTIEKDEPVAIFPEGRITVTGALMKVYQGPGLVADKTGAKVLPVFIEGAKFSRFSRMKGKLRQSWFAKIRLTILPPQDIHVDDAVKGSKRRDIAGQELENIMRNMVFNGGYKQLTLLESILSAMQVNGSKTPLVEDINRVPVSYQKLWRSSVALAATLKKPLKDDVTVGLMLPNAIPMVASFLAMHLLGKAPAMINYTMGARGIVSALRTAQVGTVVTSRKFIEMGGLDELIDTIKDNIRIIYLEDIKQQIGFMTKLKALFAGWMPQISHSMSQANHDAESTAAILFTSGSEGEPKAVVLSHANLLANRYQVHAVINFTPQDTMLNAMPLFHSFGLLAGMVLPLTTGVRLFLYPSPLHYSVIPELAYDISATILFGTNTFLAGYARKAHAYDFQSMRLVIAGAERLQDETRQIWFEQFGLRILEGYGATETSPVVSINTPIFYRSGTVGRILPGIEYHLQPIEGIEEGGRLYVKGPNIMKGYLLPDNPGVLKPPSTEQGAGWYDTGDIVSVDDQGFITIQGRAKRFAKIAGEMVSLTQVELLARQTWPDSEHVVVALADAKKGEQLVMLTTYSQPDRKALMQAAQAAGHSELLVPRAFFTISDIPLLGTGKTDYNTVKTLALELSGQTD